MSKCIMKNLFFKSLRSKQIATFIIVPTYLLLFFPWHYMREIKNQ